MCTFCATYILKIPHVVVLTFDQIFFDQRSSGIPRCDDIFIEGRWQRSPEIHAGAMHLERACACTDFAVRAAYF